MMEEKSKSTTAKWGAACSACSAAKAKCIRLNTNPGSKCDRCERLAKECVNQVHRPRKKRVNKPSKTLQLEQRINGLVDLLKASGELSLDSNLKSSPHASTTPSLVQDHSGTSDSTANPSPQDVRQECLPLQSPRSTDRISYNSFVPPACICHQASEVVAAGAQPEEQSLSDEELLTQYRQNLFPNFPFVFVADDMTAEQLTAERPVLMMAIRTVASIRNVYSMKIGMYRLICHLAEHMLLRSERSFDVVQGILVVLGWYHHHCMVHAQMNNLLHLGISMMADLGITRPARLAERTMVMVMHPNMPAPRSNDERRAVLGYYFMSSSLYMGFRKVEPMRFSAYMRQCLEELDEAAELTSDVDLAALVRLQYLAEKIAKLNDPEEREEPVMGVPRAPTDAYRLAFHNELDRLCESLPKNSKSQDVIESYIATIKLLLYEPPLIDMDLLRKFSTDFTAASSPYPTGLDYLYRSRNALCGWFDKYLSIMTLRTCYCASLPFSMHLIYSFTMLGRWARLVGLAQRPVAQSDTSQSNSTVFAAPSTTTAAGATFSNPASNLPHAGNAAGRSGGPFAGVPTLCSIDPKEISRDPKLKAALTHMCDALRNQPGLLIDVLAILNALEERFNEANQQLCPSSRTTDANGCPVTVWELTSRKIAIVKAKVIRSLDGMAEPGEQKQPQPQQPPLPEQKQQKPPQKLPLLPLYQQQQQQQQSPDNSYVQEEFPTDPNLNMGMANGLMDNVGAASLPLMGSWECNNLWADDMFDSIGIGQWLDSLGWLPMAPTIS